MASLLDNLREYITPDVISRASDMLGETEHATSAAISASIPTILSGLIDKSGDSQTIGSVMNLVNDTSLNTGDLLSNLTYAGGISTSTGLNPGSALMEMLFGTRQGSVADIVARNSGVKSASATSILGMVGSLILAYLNKTGTTTSGLTSLLASHKNSIHAAAPAGLGSLLGFGSGMHDDARRKDEVKGGGNRWLVPLLFLGAVVLGIYFLSRNCSEKVPETETTTVDTLNNEATDTIETVATDTTTALGKFFKFKLPNGVELNAPEFGIENKLNTWLNDESKVIDKTTWFNFDRLLFDTNKATLLPGSEVQLKNIVEILKAYPTVEVKIGGYTDNVGLPADNMKLSSERANAVMNEIVKMGIDAKRIAAEGYGEQHPVATNDTEEGRAQNRRIAVRVTKK